MFPVDGPGDQMVGAPVTELPLYARSGTVLVLLPGGVDTLAPSSAAGVTDLAAIGDGREVVALGGASGDFVEANGLAYHFAWSHAPDPAARFDWNGVALPTCALPPAIPAAPCASFDGVAPQVIAYVTGPGTLTVKDGGGSAASLTRLGRRRRSRAPSPHPLVAALHSRAYPIERSARTPKSSKSGVGERGERAENG